MSRSGDTGWAHAAAAFEWRTTRGQPLKNRVLWERLLELESRLAVTWRHVLGHRPKTDTSDDARYNREVDALAGRARRNFLAPTTQASTKTWVLGAAMNGDGSLVGFSTASAGVPTDTNHRTDAYIRAGLP